MRMFEFFNVKSGVCNQFLNVSVKVAIARKIFGASGEYFLYHANTTHGRCAVVNEYKPSLWTKNTDNFLQYLARVRNATERPRGNNRIDRMLR